MKLRQKRVPLFSCRCFFNPIRSPAEPMTIKRGIFKSAVWRLRRDLAEGNLNRIRLRQRATTSSPSAPDPWRASPHCASNRTAAVAHLAVAVGRDRAVRLNPAHGFTALLKRWPAVEVAQRRRLVPFETHHRRLAGRAVDPTSALSRIHHSRCAPKRHPVVKKLWPATALRLTKPTSHLS